MKLKSAIYLILVLSLTLSCSEPGRYVHKSIALMDRNGLFAEGKEWNMAREEALFQRPTTIDEAQDVVRKALAVAGGKHSFILPASNVSSLSEMEWQMPTVEILDGDIAFIKIPDFSGGEDDGKRYARTVIDGVPEDIGGSIIDLRGNTGGNMYPTIASVHRFIKDGDNMLRFKSRARTNVIPLSFILNCEGIEAGRPIDCPVAILTDSRIRIVQPYFHNVRRFSPCTDNSSRRCTDRRGILRFSHCTGYPNFPSEGRSSLLDSIYRP